jgi:hypothetical protein
VRKPGIPAVTTGDQALNLMLTAMKENIEIMTGARPSIGRVLPLASDATNEQIIEKINELIIRLNYTGN